MRFQVAGIITIAISTGKIYEAAVRWVEFEPETVRVQPPLPFKRMLQPQVIKYPDPVYSLDFDFLWNFRKAPQARPIPKAKDKYYRIVATDDGQWFSMGRSDDLHLDIVNDFNLPYERLASGLLFNGRDIEDEGDFSWVHEARRGFEKGLRRAHVTSVLWALNHGLEKDLYADWDEEYPQFKYENFKRQWSFPFKQVFGDINK